MKIFLAFLQSDTRHNIPAYSFWQYYIKNGIEEAGHRWVECAGVDWALGLVPDSKAARQAWKDEAWQKTLQWLKNNPADLFLSYLYPHQVDETAIREIQKNGIPCVNFFCDNVREFKTVPGSFFGFDLNWVPEHKAVPLYKKAGLKFIHLPMPVWVQPGQRKIQAEKFNQVTFIGSKDIQRQSFFEAVGTQQPRLPLAIYGSGWINSGEYHKTNQRPYTLSDKLAFQYRFLRSQGIKAYLRKLKKEGAGMQLSGLLQSKLHPSPNDELYNELTAQSAVTVGVNRYPSYRFPITKPGTYSRLRDIEAPMLGACYLTEWTEGLDDLYDIGNEIEVYYDNEDFILKAEELMANKEKRLSLRTNGQKKALYQHSIPQSINRIALTLGLK